MASYQRLDIAVEPPTALACWEHITSVPSPSLRSFARTVAYKDRDPCADAPHVLVIYQPLP